MELLNKLKTNFNYYYIIKLKSEEFLDINIHLGHKFNGLNRNILPFLLGLKDNISIFNINKLIKSLRLVYIGLIEIIKQRGQIFLLGTSTHLPVIDLFKYFFKKYYKSNQAESYIYINGFIGQKWISGLFSNWKGTKFLLNYLNKNPTKKNKQRFQKYLIALEGFQHTKTIFLPDFVITLNSNSQTLQEIYNTNIPIIGLNDSDIDPKLFLYSILGNDDSLQVINFFCNFLELIILKGKQLDYKRFFLTCFKLVKQKLHNDYL